MKRPADWIIRLIRGPLIRTLEAWFHEGVIRVTRRLAAGLALISLLACSGLGLCWRQLATRAHACCADQGAAVTTPAGPCASAVAKATPPTLAPPAVRPAPAIDAPLTRTAASFLSSPSRHVHVPPLVLRI
jgi:hypothetical protein